MRVSLPLAEVSTCWKEISVCHREFDKETGSHPFVGPAGMQELSLNTYMFLHILNKQNKEI